MFTGIVQTVGQVRSMAPTGGDVTLTVQTNGLDMGDVQLGDSIAVNGICLTVTRFDAASFSADMSGETLRRTAAGQWRTGTPVNLEKALLPTTRLGGHLVSGHVDGIGEVITRRQDARSVYIEVKAPDELARYLAEKGSVTVDGVSLTINQVNGAVISLNLIPHTAERTNLDQWVIGAHVNLEVDVLARYLERLLLGERAAQSGKDHGTGGVTLQMLAEHGYLDRK